MKPICFAAVLGLLAAFGALGQAPEPAQTQQKEAPVLGRGRGGAPFAWNDKNKDGICDLTGQPVGQGRPVGFGRFRGRGGGFAWGDRDGDGFCDFSGRPVRRGRGGRGWAQGPPSAQPQR